MWHCIYNPMYRSVLSFIVGTFLFVVLYLQDPLQVVVANHVKTLMVPDIVIMPFGDLDLLLNTSSDTSSDPPTNFELGVRNGPES